MHYMSPKKKINLGDNASFATFFKLDQNIMVAKRTYLTLLLPIIVMAIFQSYSSSWSKNMDGIKHVYRFKDEIEISYIWESCHDLKLDSVAQLDIKLNQKCHSSKSVY